MSTSVTFNGSTYTIPSTGEEDWGGATKVDGFLVSVAANALSKAGGTFTLNAEVDFGGTAGLKASYLKSRGTNVSTTGEVRLANLESISWRNAANSADLALSVDASNNLKFAGSVVIPASIGSANTVLASDGSAASWRTIVNADINASAAIARTKIANGTASHVVINDGSGTLSSEATLAVSRGGTNIASYTTGDLIYASAAGVLSKLAVGSSGQVLGVAAGVPAYQAAPSSTIPVGSIFDYAGASAPTGWVLASGLTIGNGASGGTARANADTETLFTQLWNDFSNTELAVSAGRGANAAADFAANKTITLPDLRGRVIIGKDNMGGSTASRITNAESGIVGTTIGASGGVESVTLTSAQSGLPAHTHTLTNGGSVLNVAAGAGSYSSGANTPLQSATITVNSNSTANAASSHSSVQPSYILNKIIKL